MIKKEDKVKIYKKIFKFCFWVLLVTFLTLYFSNVTGYYDYNLHKKTVFTEEQIKRFESDVQKGKDVQIEDYLDDKSYNYNNKVSALGYNLSTTIGNYVKDGLNFVFDGLNNMMKEENE